MKRHAHFTLVEIMVAVMVIAILIPVTMRALSLEYRLDRQAAQRRQASYLADTKLRELLITGDWRDAAAAGDFGEEFAGYRWELQVDEWSESAMTLRQLALTVYPPGTAGDRSVTLTSLTPEAEAE